MAFSAPYHPFLCCAPSMTEAPERFALCLTYLTELICCLIHLLALCGLAMLLPICFFDHFGGHVIGFDTFC